MYPSLSPDIVRSMAGIIATTSMICSACSRAVCTSNERHQLLMRSTMVGVGSRCIVAEYAASLISDKGAWSATIIMCPKNRADILFGEEFCNRVSTEACMMAGS